MQYALGSQMENGIVSMYTYIYIYILIYIYMYIYTGSRVWGSGFRVVHMGLRV